MCPLDLLKIAEQNQDRPFLIAPDRPVTLTYAEFHGAALGLAARLQEEGPRVTRRHFKTRGHKGLRRRSGDRASRPWS